MKEFLGKSKFYLGWHRNWAQRVEPQYENAAPASLFKDYLPKNVGEEVVGAHVKTMAEV